MAPKSAHDAARAKAAKEKKILLALALPLVVAVFYAYHTLSKLHHSSAPPVTPAAATTPASSVPTGTTAAAATSGATPVAAPVGLATPSPDTGKLTRLGLLAPKDPFHAQGPRSGGSSSQSSDSAKKKAKHKRRQVVRKAGPPPTAAVISVNGRLTSVALGSSFPVTSNQATNGIFRLVGLTAKAAKVAVVGGSYASGAHALTLRVDEAVTLVNTADGQRFTLVLFPQGTPAPGVATPTTTATTTTPGG